MTIFVQYRWEIFGSPVRYHPCVFVILTLGLESGRGTVSGGQFVWGGCLPKSNGGVYKGWLSRNGNPGDSVKAQASFTARPTSQAVAKAELSDPTVRYRTAEAHRIKATPGITGQSRPSVHSDGAVRHLDVGSSHPGGEEAPKGWAVRPLKRHASWVQTVVRQVGLLSTMVVET